MDRNYFLTEDQFSQRLTEFWEKEWGDDDPTPMQQVHFFIGGNLIDSHDFELDLDNSTVFAGIFGDCEKFITSDQLCSIFDEGNHCISKGSIIYEGDYAYVLWSNKGHL